MANHHIRDPERAITVAAWVAYVAIILICLDLGPWWQRWKPMSSADLASWLQAIGTVLAVLAAVWIASRQSDAATVAMRVSNRAYVGFRGIDVTVVAPKGKFEKLVFRAKAENLGVTPAADARVGFAIGALVDDALADPMIDGALELTGSTIMQGAAVHGREQSIDLGGLTKVFKKEVNVVAYALVQYRDLFGEPHKTTAYWMLEVLAEPVKVIDTKDWGHVIRWRLMPTHNVAD